MQICSQNLDDILTSCEMHLQVYIVHICSLCRHVQGWSHLALQLVRTSSAEPADREHVTCAHGVHIVPHQY